MVNEESLLHSMLRVIESGSDRDAMQGIADVSKQLLVDISNIQNEVQSGGFDVSSIRTKLYKVAAAFKRLNETVGNRSFANPDIELQLSSWKISTQYEIEFKLKLVADQLSVLDQTPLSSINNVVLFGQETKEPPREAPQFQQDKEQSKSYEKWQSDFELLKELVDLLNSEVTTAIRFKDKGKFNEFSTQFEVIRDRFVQWRRELVLLARTDSRFGALKDQVQQMLEDSSLTKVFDNLERLRIMGQESQPNISETKSRAESEVPKYVSDLEDLVQAFGQKMQTYEAAAKRNYQHGNINDLRTMRRILDDHTQFTTRGEKQIRRLSSLLSTFLSTSQQLNAGQIDKLYALIDDAMAVSSRNGDVQKQLVEKYMGVSEATFEAIRNELQFRPPQADNYFGHLEHTERLEKATIELESARIRVTGIDDDLVKSIVAEKLSFAGTELEKRRSALLAIWKAQYKYLVKEFNETIRNSFTNRLGRLEVLSDIDTKEYNWLHTELTELRRSRKKAETDQEDVLPNRGNRSSYEQVTDPIFAASTKTEARLVAAIDKLKIVNVETSGINMKWLRDTLEIIEKNERFVSDKGLLLPETREDYPALQSKIERSVKDPVLREQMLAELNARVYLHDAWVNFFVAKYDIDKINMGFLSLTPAHVETLLHGIKGVRELVGIALGMYEMALKGKLPGFEDEVKAKNWRTYSTAIQAEIGKRLGKNGALAAFLAYRIVEATGMVPFYESDFGFDVSMQMRDVMNTEGRRFYYGNANRTTGAGLRAHGYSETIGKYFNSNGAKSDVSGKDINPFVEVKFDEGEPKWDLVSDYWQYAQVLQYESSVSKIAKVARFPSEKYKQTQRIEPVKTLARRNRRSRGQAPDFSKINSKLRGDDTDAVLSAADISYLSKLPWSGIVRYDEVHTTDPQGRDLVENKAYLKWVEQMSQRLLFHKLITDTHFTAAQFTNDNWFADKKTWFDYLVNSSNTLRDMNKTDQDAALRTIQTGFLWPIVKEHSPLHAGSRTNEWEPYDILVIIYTALAQGFITKIQADFLEEQAGLKKTFLISPAELKKITRAALRTAGLPGK